MSEVLKLSRTKTHTLYRKSTGEIVPGGSTVSKMGIDSGGLLYWAWKKGSEGLDFRKVLDEEADIGTVGHFLIQCWLTGKQPDVTSFSHKCIAAGEQIRETFVGLWQREGFTTVESELSLVHEKLGFGGTIDIVASNDDGEMVLIDLKSSKKIYDAHLLQLSGYEALWNENNQEQIVQRAIWRINKHKIGDVEQKWMGSTEAYFNVFKKQLELFRAFKTLQD